MSATASLTDDLRLIASTSASRWPAVSSPSCPTSAWKSLASTIVLPAANHLQGTSHYFMSEQSHRIEADGRQIANDLIHGNTGQSWLKDAALCHRRAVKANFRDAGSWRHFGQRRPINPKCSACAGTPCATRRHSRVRQRTGTRDSCRTTDIRDTPRRGRSCSCGWSGSRGRRCRAVARQQPWQSRRCLGRRTQECMRVHSASWKPRGPLLSISVSRRTRPPAMLGAEMR